MNRQWALFLGLNCLGVAATDWDEAYAESVVEYARAAYCDRAVLQNWTCNVCAGDAEISYVSKPNSQDTQGFVGYVPSNNTIVASFRGTQDLKNWIEDLKFAKTDFNYSQCSNVTGLEDVDKWEPKCLIHSGFWTAWDSLRSDVITAVLAQREAHPNAVVLVTGHSLGAAIALLAALELQMKVGNVVIYDFGEPRVGNWYFAQFTNAKLQTRFRVVHEKDLVPHVPPLGKTPIISLDFWHEAYEVWQRGEQGLYTYTVCDSSGEDPACSDSLMPWEMTPADHARYMGRVMHDCAPPPVPPVR